MSQGATSPAPAPEAFYTPDQVAQAFQVSGSTVRGWMTQGPTEKRLGCLRVGRVYRISQAHLVAFEIANTQFPPFPPRTPLLEQDALARAAAIVFHMVHEGTLTLNTPSPLKRTAA